MEIQTAASLLPFILSALLLIVIGTTIGLSRFYFVGSGKHSYDTLTPGQVQGPRWYASANRAYINGIESMALFAPAFILHVALPDVGSGLIGTLAWVYFMARLAYSAVYVAGGYKIWCSFIWLVSFGATIVAWVLLAL